MKYTGILTALVTVLTVTLITVCPVTSRAANHAPDSYRDQGLERGVAQCSLEQGSAGCTSAGKDPAATTSIVMLAAEEDYQQVSEENDASGALLEDLVKGDRARPEARR